MVTNFIKIFHAYILTLPVIRHNLKVKIKASRTGQVITRKDKINIRHTRRDTDKTRQTKTTTTKKQQIICLVLVKICKYRTRYLEDKKREYKTNRRKTRQLEDWKKHNN